MDKIIESVLLGTIQGVTEFLPISSSAHLKIFPWLFNFTEISESFEIALHIGTLLALVIFFFKDGIKLIKDGFIRLSVLFSKKDIGDEQKQNGNLFWFIVISTIPAGLLSLLLDKISDYISGLDYNAEAISIAIASIVMGSLMYIADKISSNKKEYKNLNFLDVFLIAVSQGFAAAFPGVSRSGITITTARFRGYNAESSARISFLLSIPIVAAAALVKFKDFDLTYPIPFFLGIFVSFIVGLVVINKLMNYLKNGNYKVFAIYRIGFGILICFAILIKIFS